MKSRLLKYAFMLLVAAAAVLYYMRFRQPYQIMSGETMNTYYRIKIRTDKENNLLHNAVKDELQQLNHEMSVFENSSEISQINSDDSGDWLDLSPEMSEVLKNAYQTYIESNGYFDPTVGKLIDLWGFGNSRKTKKIPHDEQISEALKTVGFNKLLFNPDVTQIKKAIPEVKINLSAIAKGYGVDRIAKLLDNFGYTDYIVDIGGEVKTRGSRTANGKGWNVAVAMPNSPNNENAYVVGLKDYAVATSGDYRNFFYYKEKRYSHTISPKDGYPVEHNLASVTVFHPSCMRADALATAIMAMGGKNGTTFANKHNLAAILFIREEDNQFKAILSNAAKKLLGE